MITRFLYNINERGGKTLVATVEKEIVEEGIVKNSFIAYPAEKYVEVADEVVTYNYGEHFYLVTSDNKYLDINFNNTNVGISLSDNIVFAACYSKPFLAVILDHFNYFGYEDIKLISSGFSVNKRNVETDIYENFFKKCKERSYCQIKRDNKSFFIAKDENKEYILTDDFSKTVMISKKEVRKVLIIKGFVNKETDRKDISFSEFNVFSNQLDFIYGGYFGYRVNHRDGNEFEIIQNPEITTDFKLINSEEHSKKLTDLSYLLKENPQGTSTYLEFNGKYICLTANGFKIVETPSEASLIDLTQVKVIKRALSLFFDKLEFKTFENSLLYYVYQAEENNYLLSTASLNEFNGNIVSQELYENFDTAFKNKDYSKSEGNLLIFENRYINVAYANFHLTISYLDTAYNATLFTDNEAKLIIELIKIKFNKKNVVYQPDYFISNNIIKSESSNDFVSNYELVFAEIAASKHKICSFNELIDIKKESNKGSLEYLRRLYPKSYLDAKTIFNMTLRGKKNSNIMIVGGVSNVELQALNDTCLELKYPINLITVNTQIWGYNLPTQISSYLNIRGSYRLNFSDLPKYAFEEIDLILFSREFADELFAQQIEQVALDHKQFTVVNLRTCNVIKNNDYVFKYYKDLMGLKRKYFHHDQNVLNGFLEINRQELKVLYENVCKCYKPLCDVKNPILENDLSYHSIIVYRNNKAIDLYQK